MIAGAVAFGIVCLQFTPAHADSEMHQSPLLERFYPQPDPAMGTLAPTPQARVAGRPDRRGRSVDRARLRRR